MALVDRLGARRNNYLPPGVTRKIHQGQRFRSIRGRSGLHLAHPHIIHAERIGR